MVLTPADPAGGAWIGPRLAELGSSLGAIVPRGFEAYVRILHPVQVDTAAWVSWADVAARAGTTLEALSPWWRVAGARELHDQVEDEPEEGNLPEHAFRVLVEHLAAESGWDAPCVSAVWHGWGHLHDSGKAMFAWRDDGSPIPEPPKPPVGPYSREVLEGPTLELPAREYFTFACALATADAPCRYDQWRAGDLAGWQSPQLLWPLDRSWCVATEVDYDSTLVGGSLPLIEALHADPRFESFRVEASDAIDYGSAE
ncbi:MAG: hypothetical protein M3Y20_03520 [Actinomycetota bacterium]|nr:hypothetical protein [Actinomycetota bacterium]